MAKLIYSVIASLDGYIEDAAGTSTRRRRTRRCTPS